MLSLCCFEDNKTLIRWKKLTVCWPPAHRLQIDRDQEVGDADSWNTTQLPYHQPIRIMSTSWSGTLTSHFAFKNLFLKATGSSGLLSRSFTYKFFFFLSQRREGKPSAPFTHLLVNSLLHLEQSTRRKYYSNKHSVNLDFWTLTPEHMGVFHSAPGLFPSPYIFAFLPDLWSLFTSLLRVTITFPIAVMIIWRILSFNLIQMFIKFFLGKENEIILVKLNLY